MRYTFYIADNAEVPHTGVMDMETDAVVEVFELAYDPDGSKAEALANWLNEQESRHA